MKIGNREFDIQHHTYIMGILNYTPDSFSDGGSYADTDAALRRVEQMLDEGADIIDIGGESTRPGHVQISCEEEIARVAPLIARVRREFDPVISVDTYKSSVAKAAIAEGADLLNDIWGFRYEIVCANADSKAVSKADAYGDAGFHGGSNMQSPMAALAAKYGKACCLMHNRITQEYPEGFMQGVLADLSESLRLAHEGGVTDEQIILDPGIGFGKTYEQNLAVMKELGQLKALGYPVLLAASRKSVIGLTLNLPTDERLEGTIATTVYGVMQGCAFVRVHDIAANNRAIQMTEAILGLR